MKNEKKLIVIYPQKKKEEGRLDQVLRAALEGISARVVDSMEELWENGGHENGTERFRGCRILFAVPLGKNGVNRGYYEVLAWLRCGKPVLEGALAGFLIDADSELYTKAAARELAVAANQAGAALVGRPLVEGTASLDNFIIQAANMGTDRLGAYKKSTGLLAEQLLEFSWAPRTEPHLLVLHASSHKTSNTLAVWDAVKAQIENDVEIREVSLRNGTLEDCSGCPYQMCLHFGERGKCFYGGPIVESVYPGIQWADGLLLLCPNYNDALSANLTAFINRLTALFRTTRFYDKALFAIIVSGYSGSDLIAGQLITALNMNKTFYLPGNFCIMETGNSPGSALKQDGVEGRIRVFADMIRKTLKADGEKKER